MRPIRDFLIKVNNPFEDERTVGNIKIYLSSVFEDPFQQKKEAEVIAEPMIDPGFKVGIGNHIFFKHTLLRDTWVERDRKEYSQFMIDPVEKIYRVPISMVYAYHNENGLNITEEWVIIKPLVKEDEVRPSGIIIPGMGKELNQVGKITHIGSILKSKGFKIGDTVIWNKNSEYEVKINKEKHYRMHYDWIIGKYGC